MLKRVLAWVLLAGFVFLIFNIIIFGFYLKQSVIVYLIIVFVFIFTNRKPNHSKADYGNGGPGDGTEKTGDDTDDNAGDRE